MSGGKVVVADSLVSVGGVMGSGASVEAVTGSRAFVAPVTGSCAFVAPVTGSGASVEAVTGSRACVVPVAEPDSSVAALRVAGEVSRELVELLDTRAANATPDPAAAWAASTTVRAATRL
ncbi:MAG: hypothetical protein K0V04_26930 [Deltaproteobacteria bacterium]|nr:hypothetical protein [Deltaproteobacteria bacterium]